AAAPEPPVSAPEPPAPEPSVAPDPPATSASPESLVEPARLNDALSRLRDTIAPQDATPAVAAVGGAAADDDAVPAPTTALVPSTSVLVEALGRPTLEPAFRRLVRADAEAAGRLLLELLPLQRVAYPHPVSYDLVLGSGRGCVSVTVTDGSPTIGVQSTPRPRQTVDFQVHGEPARIARMLVAGRLRRRLGIGVARVRGRRGGAAALQALLGTPLDLSGLYRAGVRLDAASALQLVASMIEPGWTVGHRLTLAHTEPRTATTYLLVRDGKPIEIARSAPEGAVDVTLRCPADRLLPALSDVTGQGAMVEGDAAALELVRGWIGQAETR
ncbi:MAG: hypothetical protein WBQ18_08180, partial [Solirubrobacteraceae bacterium]